MESSNINNKNYNKTKTVQAEKETPNSSIHNYTEKNDFIKTQVKWKISENTDPLILNKFKSQFNNVEEFLKLDNDLIFGKKIDHNEKFKSKENIKPYQIIGDIENIFPPLPKPSNTALNASNSTRNHCSKNFTFSESAFNANSLLARKSNYENYLKRYSMLRRNLHANIMNLNVTNKDKDNVVLLTDEQVDKIFEEKNNKTIENHNDTKKYNEEILRNVDPQCAWEMQDLLGKQEKALLKREEIESQVNNLAKFIAKKTQKDETELLMNKTDGFRLKTQCIQRIQSSNPIKTFNYGVENDWMLNLRKKDNDCFQTSGANFFTNKEGKGIVRDNSNKNYDFYDYSSEVGKEINNYSKFNKNFSHHHGKIFYNKDRIKFNKSNKKDDNSNKNDDKAIIKRNLLSRSKSKKELKMKTQLDIRVRNNDDLGAVVYEGNKVENIENLVKPNSASLKDFRKYANTRTISSRLRTINLTCEELIKANDLSIKGDNLLTFEKEMAKKLHGKKYILKDNLEKSNATLQEVDFNTHYNRLDLLKNKF